MTMNIHKETAVELPPGSRGMVGDMKKRLHSVIFTWQKSRLLLQSWALSLKHENELVQFLRKHAFMQNYRCYGNKVNKTENNEDCLHGARKSIEK
ncbi:hypothetical protein NQ317_010275 [Molorchus minor]|uniref:Uncharacterized protein n=1 Tax=Molorchus minor TaxID=1323400 RepID=A0ABQ9J4P0_9CUCU|nr:hypothetical protein NQ317_010275 [Molorchus minor]